MYVRVGKKVQTMDVLLEKESKQCNQLNISNLCFFIFLSYF